MVCQEFGLSEPSIPSFVAKYIFPLTTHEFEGRQFPVPGNADAHLRHLYGDYMQLPDLNKLAPHVARLEFFDE